MYRNNNKVFAPFQFKSGSDPQKLVSEPLPAAPQSRRKIWPLFPVVCMLALLCVCVLPWRSRIRVNLPCMQISADGTVTEAGQLRIEGWHYRYLIRQDTVKLTALKLPGSEDLNPYWDAVPVFFHSEDVLRHFTTVQSRNNPGTLYLDLYFSVDGLWYAAEFDGQIFFGTTDPELSAEEIISRLPLIFHRNPACRSLLPAGFFCAPSVLLSGHQASSHTLGDKNRRPFLCNFSLESHRIPPLQIEAKVL